MTADSAKALARLREKAQVLADAGLRLGAAYEEYYVALLAAAGATVDDVGQPPELIERARVFAGAPTVAERLYRNSVRETTRGEPGGTRERDALADVQRPRREGSPGIVSRSVAEDTHARRAKA